MVKANPIGEVHVPRLFMPSRGVAMLQGSLHSGGMLLVRLNGRSVSERSHTQRAGLLLALAMASRRRGDGRGLVSAPAGTDAHGTARVSRAAPFSP